MSSTRRRNNGETFRSRPPRCECRQRSRASRPGLRRGGPQPGGAKLAAAHLAGVVTQRLVDALEGPRDFVRGDALTHPSPQLIVGYLGVELDDRVRGGPEILVR